MKNKFYYLLLLFTVIIAVVHLLAIRYSAISWNSIFIVLYVYFPLITAFIYKVLCSKISQRPQQFVTYFMGSMALKLFLSLFLLLIVLYTHPLLKIQIVLLFMLMYLIYTTLSVVFLFKKLRQ